VSASQLQQLARSGQIQSTDLVWKEGLPQWIQAKAIKAFSPPRRTHPHGQVIRWRRPGPELRTTQTTPDRDADQHRRHRLRIPQDQLNASSSRFSQQKRKAPALGLMIVQRIVREHGGPDQLSHPRQGTTFRIGLPLHERQRGCWRRAGMIKPMLLIVDDEKPTREALRARWRNATTFIWPKTRPRRRVAGEGNFDVLLTDLRLPSEDGMKLIARASRSPSRPCAF